jgi:DNA polymerase-3 subunit chi
MPPVEFIKLEKPEKARCCCILAEEFWRRGKRVLIVVKDGEQGRALDRFMWTWQKTSFIPHVFLPGNEKETDEPVIITTDQSKDFGASILIMAEPCPLEFIRRFEGACDFAELYDRTLHEEARRRFVLYRDNEFEPRMRQ